MAAVRMTKKDRLVLKKMAQRYLKLHAGTNRDKTVLYKELVANFSAWPTGFNKALLYYWVRPETVGGQRIVGPFAVLKLGERNYKAMVTVWG